jgi:hypothetical protein
MASLNNICYQQIKDTFYFGIFGEFQLVVDKSTGCFNATKLCNLGGKKFIHWKCLERSRKIMDYCKSRHRDHDGGFFEVAGDNKDHLSKQITGQYVQKELILDIASWISPEFYFKCNEIVMNYFVSEYKNMSSDERDEKIRQLELKMKDLEIEKDEIIQEKSDKIRDLFDLVEEQNRKMDQEREERKIKEKQMEEQNKQDRATMARQELMLQKLGITLDDVAQQNDELIEKVDDQKVQIETVQKKLNIAVEDRAPQPEQTGKRERFILLKRNDEDYPYYTIRAQHSSALTALRKQRQVYETVDILLDLNCHPNSKTLYVRIKNELKQQGVVFKLCKISIENSEVDEEKLINVMKGVNEEKRNV